MDGKGGFVYVADMGNCRVQKFTTDGEFVLAWGTQGSAEGMFHDVHSVAVDADGQVYVTDSLHPDLHRVQKFTPDGRFLLAWGGTGGGDGEFHCPGGIAVDGEGFVYVVDIGNCRVQKFTKEGLLIDRWGNKGNGFGEFQFPSGIAASHSHADDGHTFLYVADSLNRRVQKFTTDGQFLLAFGSQGRAGGQFENPRSIALTPDGTLFVVDTNQHCVHTFSA